MTKRTKLSRISDSASGGKGETMARETRAKEWIAANYDNWFSARKAACKTMYGHEPVIELLTEFAESECSRLASRVEELERLVKIGFEGLDAIMSAPEPIGWYVGKGTMDKVEAAWRTLQNAAGAHAEEKE